MGESDFELRGLALLSRRLPPSRISRFLVRRLRKFYTRRPREDAVAPVDGQLMRLCPSDYVEGLLLFAPQLYERTERQHAKRLLRPGDTFVDLGAHVGLYTLLAARSVGPDGTVVAVEANPRTYEQLVENLRRNGLSNVATFQFGVSDRAELRMLSVNTTGNRGASSFLISMGEGIEVECLPLAQILAKAGIDQVRGVKLDIEGYEFRVLDRFFKDAAESLYPAFVLIEQKDWWIDQAGGNAVELLKRRGYRIVWRSRDRKKWPNYLLVRP